LRRTSIGPFAAANALPLDADAATARAGLLPLSAAVVALPHIRLDADRLTRLRQGQSIPIAEADLVDLLPEEPELALFDKSGELAAITSVYRDKLLLRPAKVLPARSPKPNDELLLP